LRPQGSGMLPLPPVFLCRKKFSCFVSSKIDFLGLEASVVSFEGQIAVSRQEWQWRVPDDWLIFS
jgi:hypothetical protein